MAISADFLVAMDSQPPRSCDYIILLLYPVHHPWSLLCWVLHGVVTLYTKKNHRPVGVADRRAVPNGGLMRRQRVRGRESVDPGGPIEPRPARYSSAPSSCVSDLLDAGVDISVVQQIVGHCKRQYDCPVRPPRRTRQKEGGQVAAHPVRGRYVTATS